MKKEMLTTTDNPYDPFKQFEEWYAFDVGKGYHTCSYLARVAITTDQLGEVIEEEAIDRAMKEIIKLNLTGNYKIVTPKDYKHSNIR